MKPTIVLGAIGDEPPEAHLYYGLNVLDSLRLLPDNSVNTVCTSPPYWSLRDYGVGHQVWGGDPDCDHDWGDEIKGKGQSGGTENSTLGVTGNPMSEEGLQRTLQRSHAKPRSSAFCKHCNAWRGCLGLEPTPDLFVKHMVLIGREIRRVLHPKGTFWLNLGDSYMSHAAKDYTNLGGREGERIKEEGGYGTSIVVGRPSKVAGLKDKDLVGIPWRTALALQADGWWLRNNIIWRKKNAMPSSVRDRFSCKYEYVFLFAKQARYFFDLDAVKVPHTYGTYDDDGNFEPAQQWFESGEGTRKMDQTEGQLGELAGSPRRKGRGLFSTRGKNPGDVWDIATGGYRGAHFAVWPQALVERMILAGTSAKGRCPTCKSPWERIVEAKKKGRIKKKGTENLTGNRKGENPDDYDRLKLKGSGGIVPSETQTVGWRPTCDCPEHEPERCVVMDTFSGSGTTGFVAMKHGRSYVGLDLNPEYLPLAEARLTGRKAPQPDDEIDLIGEMFG